MNSRSLLLTSTTLACLLLAACDSSTGGAAGDEDDIAAAVNLLAPYTGIYRILGNWQGVDDDEAYLDIQTPGSDGVSPVDLYDFDEFDNCLIAPPFNGTLEMDDFRDEFDEPSERVFMNGLFQFDEAELTRSDDSTLLTITFNDNLDLDGDGSTQDRISINANRVGVAQETDLGSTC